MNSLVWPSAEAEKGDRRSVAARIERDAAFAMWLTACDVDVDVSSLERESCVIGRSWDGEMGANAVTLVLAAAARRRLTILLFAAMAG